MTAQAAAEQLQTLLIRWCDALVRLQAESPDRKELDGGILCPACGRIHGRCHEAVYPLLCAARRTGNAAYLAAARRLFAWGENMRCADGGFRNDFGSDWKGVTVFAAIALHDALHFHGDLLPAAEKAAWEARLLEMGAWLFENLTEQTPAYLNYYAANACAMALLGAYFSNDAYRSLAGRLAAHCLRHVSENGLLFGEGRPGNAVSPRGCRAIDVGGYNAEETLPCLTRYAAAAGDRAALDRCRALWQAQLCWMLPDGAWDNSTGTRAFKWTYWGSRTADGCQAALFSLAKSDPVFAEAAWRNFELLRRCTHGGLLAGGPAYTENGEPICVHHTFCHAKVLAAALDGGIEPFTRVPLPADRPEPVRFYPELNVLRLACGPWRMDVCGYDFAIRGAAHASGGSISLLWHETAGPLIAAGAVDDTLKEPHNQQRSVRPETHRSLCPRVEAATESGLFAQHRCPTAALTAAGTPDGLSVQVGTALCSEDGVPLPGGECALEYLLCADALILRGSVLAVLAADTRLVLPLIGKAAAAVLEGRLCGAPEPVFNLSPGFRAAEYRIAPTPAGRFCVRIAAAENGSPG